MKRFNVQGIDVQVTQRQAFSYIVSIRKPQFETSWISGCCW